MRYDIGSVVICQVRNGPRFKAPIVAWTGANLGQRIAVVEYAGSRYAVRILEVIS